jgi:copper chaperone
MIDMTIPDMTCGGCARAVSAAIKTVDPTAEIATDVAARKVQIKTSASAAALQQAVVEAGFTPN